VPLDAYDQSSRAAAAAFDAPGALNRPCAVSYGPVPGSVYAGHRFLDVLIHGWDLAVATGQDTHLDPALVEACWDEIQPQADSLQASGMFGQPGSAAPDADPQTRLLARWVAAPTAGSNQAPQRPLPAPGIERGRRSIGPPDRCPQRGREKICSKVVRSAAYGSVGRGQCTTKSVTPTSA